MSQDTTDRKLLEAYALNGNEHAFEELVDRHLPLVYGLASREIYDFRLAEEITQNVFCALARHSLQQREIERVSAWLYGTTRKQIAQTMRSERRRKQREERAAAMAEGPEEEPNNPWKDLVPQLNVALSKLSPGDQKVLFLRFYEDLSLSELGDSLEIKERAAQKRLQRAIERLRGLLARQGIVMTSSMLGGGIFTAGAATPPASLAGRIHASTKSITLPPADTPGFPTSLGGVISASPILFSVLSLALVASSIAVFWQIKLLPPTAFDNPAPPTHPVSLLAHRTSSPKNGITLAVDDIEGIYGLESKDREVALSRLLTHLTRPRGETYLTNLFRRWSDLDHERLARSLVQLHNRCGESESYANRLGELMTIPMGAWMSADTVQAQAWVKRLPRSGYAEAYAFESVLDVMAQTDHDAAWEWLSGRPFNRQRAFDILTSHVIATKGVTNALDWLGQLRADPGFFELQTEAFGLSASQAADRSRTEVWKRAVTMLFPDHSQAVADWVVALPSSDAADGALAAFVNQWTAGEPSVSSEWALTLPEDTRQSVVPGVASAWAARDPEASLDWAQNLTDPDLRWTAVNSAFAAILKTETSNPGILNDVLHWVEPLAGELRASPLFKALGQTLPGPEAARWVADLPVGENRNLALNHVYYRLGRDSPDKAVQFLGALPETDQARAAEFLSLGWLVGGGRKELKQWQATLPNDGTLFLASTKAEIDLLAALNPERAARVVLSFPTTLQRDPFVVLLIERTTGRSSEHASLAEEWTADIVDQRLRKEMRGYVTHVRRSFEEKVGPQPVPEIDRIPFAEQTLEQLRKRLDYVSRRVPREGL